MHCGLTRFEAINLDWLFALVVVRPHYNMITFGLGWTKLLLAADHLDILFFL
jgi:hypothetical protein